MKALCFGMFCLSLSLQCQVSRAGQPPPGTVLWSYSLNAPASSSPALWTNGTIYVGTPAGLYAITNSGPAVSNKWVFPAPVRMSAAIGNDGTIYFGDASPSASFHAIH